MIHPIAFTSHPRTPALTVPVTALLTLFIIILRPEITQSFLWPERTVYWAAHALVVFGTLGLARMLLFPSSTSRSPAISRLLLCGLGASLLAAPCFALLDHWWANPAVEDIDSWLDRLEASGIAGGLVAEWLETTPWLLTIWLLATWRPGTNQAPYSDPRPLLVATRIDTPSSAATAKSVDSIKSGNSDGLLPTPGTHSGSAQNSESRATPILDRIPPYYGSDVIAVTSQLHDLCIHTTIGQCTVAGSFRDVIIELQGSGIQIHRSHWVANRHVIRTTYAQGKAACVLSNGLSLAVSRRRWQTVRSFFGTGVIKREPDQMS